MQWLEKVQLYLDNIGWKVNELNLYAQALTHSSYAHEKSHHHNDNERLEFLGDAVLELIISDYLYAKYPQLSEGKLTRFRAELVCETSLTRLAFGLNLGQQLRLGKGEIVSGGSSRPSLLGDTVEALIGAIYLDHGLEECRKNVLELYKPILLELQEGILYSDYKTLLQEFSQARYAVTPVYRITHESGPDHSKEFEAEVILDLNSLGSGYGRSKKEAEQAAAKEAWSKITP
ncbi:MAG: ribonuclease III [Clostridia bacterium]|nr:ribonuclease III [Clostridia bacterium]